MFSKLSLATGLLFAAATTTTPLASAWSFTNSIHAPSTVTSGQNFTVTVESIAIVFGLTPLGTERAGVLGNEVLRESYLGAQDNNPSADVTFGMYVPTNSTKGDAVLTASVLSLTSEYHAPTLDFSNVSVTVGDRVDASQLATGEGYEHVLWA
ncbi:hypothetical protein B0J12DRAFT_784036 [Macrophomina phaseolina]|uniref:Uncharacterized protein n=1 Tax=Macrophomina phaseolina TaxID=35725 RepID=A0ABQ8GH45_9PEZI|nr:hypothetical protein B0J12DRAFT_784036 [Macrophomina phaseolina]